MRSDDMKDMQINSEANDFYFLFLQKIFKKEIPILLIVLLYFLVSFGGILAIGIATGSITSEKFDVMMKDDYISAINMGFLVPIGMLTYLYLYKKIRMILVRLYESGAIEDKETAKEIAKKYNKAYGRKYPMVIALLLSIIANVFVVNSDSNCWYSWGGGITAYYYWFFAVLNIYLMFMMFFYKCVVTIHLMYKISKSGLTVRIEHHDKCCGMKPVGDLYVSVNYLFFIIVFYATLRFFVHPESYSNVLFVFLYVIGVLLFITALMLTLRPVIRKTKEIKSKTLLEMGRDYLETSKLYLNNLKAKDYNRSYYDKMNDLESTMQKISHISPWPLDFSLYSKYIATILTPLAIFAFQFFKDDLLRIIKDMI
jgi:hypothetical protein